MQCYSRPLCENCILCGLIQLFVDNSDSESSVKPQQCLGVLRNFEIGANLWTGASFNCIYRFPEKKHWLIGGLGAWILEYSYINKPAVQAAGADPPQWKSPIGKIHPFSKINVTFEPIVQFWYPLMFGSWNILNVCNIVNCMTRSTNSNLAN